MASRNMVVALLTWATLFTAAVGQNWTASLNRDPFSSVGDSEWNDYRYVASWYDEVEAIVASMLDNEITKIQLMGMNTTSSEYEAISEGFNLTLTNHNLKPAVSMNETDGFIFYGDSSEVADLFDQIESHINTTAAPLPSTVYSVYVMSSGCGDGDFDTLSQYEVADTLLVYCVRLVPDINNSFTIDVQSWVDAIANVTDSLDTFLDLDYSVVMTYPGTDVNITYGPFLVECTCTCRCFQGSRTVWIYGVDSVLFDTQTSDRGSCGAPLDELEDSEKSIVFGQSAAFSGPSKHMGAEMREGIIAGMSDYLVGSTVPRVILISMDDGYEKPPCEANTRFLIDSSKVLVIIGSTGTPTASVAYPYAVETETPFVCPFTGARFLRNPANKVQANVRASYDDEAEAFVSYMLEFGSTNFAFFGQNDGYGNAVIAGLELSLLKRGLEVMSDGRYERNTADVQDGLDLMVTYGRPDAVFMGGTATALAKFVGIAKTLWPGTLYACVSFVGASTFRQTLAENATDVMVMQSIYPGQSLLDEDGKIAYNWIIDEGYLCGRMVASILKNMNQLYTSENFIEAVYGTGAIFEMEPGKNIGPMYINDVENCTQGIRTVYATQFDANGDTIIVSEQAQPGCGQDLDPVIVNSLKFGITAAFSGPSAGLGTNMRDGIEAAFYKFNKKGGVNGRLVRLIAMDDGYSTEPALANAMDLVINETVFGLLGCTGTPTALAMTPWLLENKVPFLQPFTGARFLRNTTERYFVNLRASYDDEVRAFVEYAVARGRLRISIFYQNDGFGIAGLNALNMALYNNALTLFSNGTYERNTADVELGLSQMVNVTVSPQAVVMIGTAIALAKFVDLAQAEWGDDVLFHTVSFVGSEVFSDELRARNVSLDNKVFVTQVVPFIQGETTSMVYDEYVADLADFCDTCVPGFGSMEGYLGARMVLDSVSEVDFIADLTVDLEDATQLQQAREEFLDNLYFGSSYSAGDLTMGPFLEDCNQGLYVVYLTSINATTGLYIDHPDYKFEWEVCNENVYEVADDELPIVFGQAAAFSGTAKDLGREMREGIQAAFNVLGSVAGRKVYLLTCDDGYEPDRAVVCLDFFLSNDNILGMIGSVGTPTAYAMLDTILDVELPWIGPFTGARKLRDPFKRPIINVRGSYDDEVAAMIQFLVESDKADRISIMYQADGFGGAGYDALILSLEFQIRTIYSEGTYVRNTLDVQESIDLIFPSDTNDVDDVPNAVVMIGTALPLAKFVEDVTTTIVAPDDTESDCTAGEIVQGCIWFYTVSFVGSVTFADSLGAVALTEDVFISQVVPIPSDVAVSPNTVELMDLYDSALATLELNEFGVVARSLGSMEGFFTGSVLTQTLSSIDFFTRPDLLDGFYAVGTFSLGGVPIGPFIDDESGDEACNQGLRFITVSVINVSEDLSYVFDVAMDPYTFTDDCGVLKYFAPPDCKNGTEAVDLYPGINTKAECEDCVKGTYSTFGDLCSDCPIGYTTDGDVAWNCSVCQAGSYGPRTGAYQCIDCQAGKFNEANGSSTCYDCPENAAGTVGASSRNDCSCSNGYYSVGDEDDWECFECNTPDWSTYGRACIFPMYQHSSGTRLFLSLLGIMAILFCLVCMGLTFTNREHITFKSGSPQFLLTNNLGAVIAIAEIFFGVAYPPIVGNCIAIPFVHSFGFALMIGSIIVKEWRITTVYNSVFARRKMTDEVLYQRLAAIVIVSVLVNVVALIMEAPTLKVLDSDALYASYEQCSSSSGIWLICKIGFDVILLALALNYSWQSRKVPAKAAESRRVIQVMYNVGLCYVADNALMLVLSSPDAKFALHAVMTIVMACVNVALLFIPKFLGMSEAEEEGHGHGDKKKDDDFSIEDLFETLINWKEGKEFPKANERQIEQLLLSLRSKDSTKQGSGASNKASSAKSAAKKLPSTVPKSSVTEAKTHTGALGDLQKHEIEMQDTATESVDV